MTLQRKQQGFTIVELLIVIVVIGILATLAVTTFAGVQVKARDTKRQTDIIAIHGQLETFYSQNGSYPAMAQVNDTAWRAINMKGLDANALKDPNGATQALAATSTATAYGYSPTKDDDTACTTAAADCTKYTLIATLEGGGTYSETSLN